MNFTPILEKLQGTALSRGIKELAADFDLSASQMYAQLNPYAREKNIRFDRALEIMERADDFSALAEFFDQLGYRIVQKDVQPDGEDMREECLQAYEACAAFLTSANGNAPYTETFSLLEKAHKELDHVFARLRNEQARKYAPQSNAREVVKQ